jgi:nicotinate dehydrogenase subunit B
MNNPTINPGMTPDARFSRRNFLKTAGGALIVSFSSERMLAQGTAPGAPAMNQVDSWIAIAADGSITAYSGKEELGQGIWTAQQQLVAEELSVPFDSVKLIYCDTALTPDQATTSGSQSHPTNFNHGNLAQAAATVRETLFRLASQRLATPVDQLNARDGVISVKTDASKKVTYGELVGGKKFNLTVSSTAKRKPPSEWTVLGKPVTRPDLAPLVTGQFEFVHNVRLPGMLHGRVVRPPTVGAKILDVDESSVKDMPGLVKVVVKNDFVGVVAQKPWQAMQAAEKLRVTWSRGPALPSHADFYDHLRNQKPTRDTLTVDSKDVDQKLAQAFTGFKATYLYPYQMHGSMGSSCAVADIQGDKGTVYSPTQAVWFQKSSCAMVLGLKPENLHVIFRRGSGCYGLNGADTVTYDAALLSQAVGKPVRVQLSRKDEMAWENYGNSYVIDERAGVDAQGNIVAWDHESWSPGRGNRPGTNQPGNVITGLLVGFQPAAFAGRSPAPEPGAFNNNSNAVPSYLAGRVGGVNRGTGTIQSGRVMVHNVESAFWTGPLRSPARLQNTFAHESFMDELAARVKADPVEYRLRHLSDPRLIDVLKAATKGANWESRPSPKPGNKRTGIAAGRGTACVLYEGDNGYSAIAVELEVNQDTGQITVKRIVAANDVGPVSNPDGLRNQIEGGALQGMSRALLEEVTWDDQKVTSFDWRTYRTLPMGFAVPKIESVLMNRPDAEATGAGETSITVIAAAIGNAIFDATGVRLRQIPFTPERVKAALAARA